MGVQALPSCSFVMHRSACERGGSLGCRDWTHHIIVAAVTETLQGQESFSGFISQWILLLLEAYCWFSPQKRVGGINSWSHEKKDRTLHGECISPHCYRLCCMSRYC